MHEIDKYFIITDKIPKSKPIIYLMTHNGFITQEVNIKGLTKVKEMEAITIDELGNIIIVCSQRFNKTKKMPESRKLFLRIVGEGYEFKLDKNRIDKRLLKKLLPNDKNLDIYGDISYIIMIKNINKVFDENSLIIQ